MQCVVLAAQCAGRNSSAFWQKPKPKPKPDETQEMPGLGMSVIASSNLLAGGSLEFTYNPGVPLLATPEC